MYEVDTAHLAFSEALSSLQPLFMTQIRRVVLMPTTRLQLRSQSPNNLVGAFCRSRRFVSGFGHLPVTPFNPANPVRRGRCAESPRTPVSLNKPPRKAAALTAVLLYRCGVRACLDTARP